MNQQILTTYRITEEQLGRCHRVEDLEKRIVFYIVESQSEPGTEYKVIYNPVLKALQCLPHTGKVCQASAEGKGCWHKRGACASAAEYRAEQAAEQEAAMIELSEEINAEACTPFTTQVDETSSSLDGVTFEDRNGRPCPMR